jgi:hypothetical protein
MVGVASEAAEQACVIEAALGDLDGDGNLDVVFATPMPHNSAVWLNDGSGTTRTFVPKVL